MTHGKRIRFLTLSLIGASGLCVLLGSRAEAALVVTLSVAPPADTSITGNEQIAIEAFVVSDVNQPFKFGQIGFFCTITSGTTMLTSTGVTTQSMSAGGVMPLCPGGLASVDQTNCFASRSPNVGAPPCSLTASVPAYLATITYDVSDCANDTVEVHVEPLGVDDGIPAATDETHFRDDAPGSGNLIPVIFADFDTFVPDLGTCCDGATCLTDGVNEYCCVRGLWGGGTAGVFNSQGTTCAAPSPCGCGTCQLEGDVAPPGGDCVVNGTDIAFVQNAMVNSAAFPGADIYPCTNDFPCSTGGNCASPFPDCSCYAFPPEVNCQTVKIGPPGPNQMQTRCALVDVDDFAAVLHAFNGGAPFCGHPCPPRGACCNATACSIVPEANCLAANGTYFGDGTVCNDADNDGVHNFCDNCPNGFNPGQEDCDSDGLGDFCDPTAMDCDGNHLDDACEGSEWMPTGTSPFFYRVATNWSPNEVPVVLADMFRISGSNTAILDSGWFLGAPDPCDLHIGAAASAQQTLRVDLGGELHAGQDVEVNLGGVLEMNGGRLSGEDMSIASGGLLSGHGEICRTSCVPVGTLVNEGNILVPNAPVGLLTVKTDYFENASTGTIVIEDGSTMNLQTAFMNDGPITIEGNPPTSVGQFRVKGIINRSGVSNGIHLMGGELRITVDTVNNPSTGDRLTNKPGGFVTGYGTIPKACHTGNSPTEDTIAVYNEGDGTNNGILYATGNMTIRGDIVNEGTLAVTNGILSLCGVLKVTGNGSATSNIIPCSSCVFRGESTATLEIDGAMILDPLTTLDFPGGRIEIFGPALDIAIDDPSRFNLASATIQVNRFNFLGPVSIEALADPVDGADGSIDSDDPNLFLIDILEIGPDSSNVTIVDNHDNGQFARTGGESALYVNHLIVHAGSTLTTGEHVIYYVDSTVNGLIVGNAIQVEVDCGSCRLYGDVFPLGGDCVVDLDDLLTMLDGFANSEMHPEDDIAPCGGDGIIDVDDLISLLEGFANNYLCPHPCPP